MWVGTEPYNPAILVVTLTTERTVVGGDSSLETGASFENSLLEMYTLTSYYKQDGDGEVLTDLPQVILFIFFTLEWVRWLSQRKEKQEEEGHNCPAPSPVWRTSWRHVFE